jgi:hypothetical protein
LNDLAQGGYGQIATWIYGKISGKIGCCEPMPKKG